MSQYYKSSSTQPSSKASSKVVSSDASSHPPFNTNAEPCKTKASSSRPQTVRKWRRLLNEFEQSRLTPTEFCRSHFLTPSTFYAWRKKLRSRPSPPLPSDSPAFVSLKIQDLSAPSGPAISPSSKRDPTPLVVQLTNEIRIRVSPDFHALTLQRLVQTLSTCSLESGEIC